MNLAYHSIIYVFWKENYQWTIYAAIWHTYSLLPCPRATSYGRVGTQEKNERERHLEVIWSFGGTEKANGLPVVSALNFHSMRHTSNVKKYCGVSENRA